MIKKIITMLLLTIVSLFTINIASADEKKITYKDVSKKIEILRSSVIDYQYATLIQSKESEEALNRVKFDFKQVEVFIELYKRNSTDKYAFRYQTRLSEYLNNYSYRDIKFKAGIKENISINQLDVDLFKRDYLVKGLKEINKEMFIIVKVNQKSSNQRYGKGDYPMHKKSDAIIDTAIELSPINNYSMINSIIAPNSPGYQVAKLDKENFDGKYSIDINKLVDQIDADSYYNITHGIYIKHKGYYFLISGQGYSNYISSASFSFNNYDIKSFFEKKYREETGEHNNYGYSRDIERDKALREKIYTHLDTIFNKYKVGKTSQQYVEFLIQIQKKVSKFKKTENFNEEAYNDITSPEKSTIAYKLFKRNKNKLKIVSFLSSYLSEEIYKNTLEDTISDFLPKQKK